MHSAPPVDLAPSVPVILLELMAMARHELASAGGTLRALDWSDALDLLTLARFGAA